MPTHGSRSSWARCAWRAGAGSTAWWTPTGAPFVNGSDADFSFGFGYGIGYGFSNRFTVEVVQDLSIVMHQRTGLSASDDSNVHLNSTRIVGRLGLGSKR